MGSQHALLSPSSAERWMTCVGAPAMEAGLPDTPSEYSDEGTAAHLLLSTGLQADKVPEDYRGKRIEVGSSKSTGFDGAIWVPGPAPSDWIPRDIYKVDDEMIAAVGRVATAVCRYQGAAGRMHVEKRVSISSVTGEPGAEGTADVVVIIPKDAELQVHDLKYGMGVKVSAIRNRQLMIYALGVKTEFELDYGPFKRVRLVIHQPRLEHLSEWDCSIEELERFKGEASAKAVIALALRAEGQQADNAQWAGTYLNPSDDGCRWCKAKPACPELTKFVLRQTRGDFEKLASFPIAQGTLRQETPAGLALKMSAVGLVEDWCKGIRAEVERQLFAGIAIPGWKIVQGKRGNRSWTDTEKVEGLLKKKFRLRDDQVYDMKLMSPTSIEKRMKDHPRWWAQLLKMIGQREGQPSVAAESDPRPVWVAPEAKSDFMNEETEDLV